jgi:hypothetical protein
MHASVYAVPNSCALSQPACKSNAVEHQREHGLPPMPMRVNLQQTQLPDGRVHRSRSSTDDNATANVHKQRYDEAPHKGITSRPKHWRRQAASLLPTQGRAAPFVYSVDTEERH